VHPEVFARWHSSSNTLVLLAVPDECALHELCERAVARRLLVTRFHEPDLGWSLTAGAFEPEAHRLLSHLPLLNGRREVNKDDNKHRA